MTPTSRSSATRRQILDATTELLAERGTTATGFNQIVEASGVSYGSIYHQFSGGKAQLVGAAVEAAGAEIRDASDLALQLTPDLASAAALIFDHGAGLLVASDFRRGCPVGTAIADGHTVDQVRDAAAATFAAWNTVIVDRATALGMSRDDSERFASIVVSLYEGALLVARATRSVEPLGHARATAMQLVEVMTS